MYTLILALHSWLRWGAILAGVVALRSTLSGDVGSAASDSVDRWGLAFMMALDVQMLLGLILYFVLSPNTAAMFNNYAAAVRDPVTRFWAFEHVATMVSAVVIVHVGRVMARKAPTLQIKRVRLFMYFAIALVAILVGTPWPGLANGRPLFRI